jgi:hypothetical protein
MPPDDMHPPEADRPKRSSDDRYLFKLWVIVSVLWTIATAFRVARIWLLVEGWRGVLSGLWLWLEIGLPPLLFGFVMLAVRQLCRNHENPHITRPWCRR